jgi:uncharacterized protein YjbJ (UPF0337 family)
MNDQPLVEKVRQDAEKVKQELTTLMNHDVFEGKWKRMRGQAKVWWGKLTDDDLQKVDGKLDQLLGLLQQKYGYSRQQAEEEFKKRTK